MKGLIISCSLLLCGSAFGYKVSGTTYITNGSQSDVQAACSAAPDNGTITVLIPNGTYSWTGNLAITHSLTLAGASATGVTIKNNNASGAMIAATASPNGHINIYRLNIIQIANNAGGTGYALVCDRAQPTNYTVLVHDSTFNAGSIPVYMVQCLDNGIIFWNDVFTGGAMNCVCDKYGYTASWNTPDTMGANDTTGLSNTYIENCTFEKDYFATNFDDNSRIVARYNT
ncbi:MAG: hypothetical protein WBZ19_21235, partial [Chthoniobacterales bacterium]